MVGEDEKQRQNIANLIDKIDKMSAEKFNQELEALGINKFNIKRINQYLKINWHYN